MSSISRQNGPAVVVVGYNRPESINRLLESLLAADYPPSVEVPLIISLDFCSDKIISKIISTVCENISWPYGTLRIIQHEKKKGLKQHILSCGDLTEEYNSVLVLEDDLFVSPAYYQYAFHALNYYGDDQRIAGISLYTHHANPCIRKPFWPIEDGTDVFFLSFASSWGQAWNKEQWKQFRDWYSEEKCVNDNDLLPDALISWPDSSWLKLFIKYMVEREKVFVYPRVSLTTNFGDSGTHFAQQDSYYQVPILSTTKDWIFVSIDNSMAVYDAFFEIEPRIIHKLTNYFKEKELTIDLYGKKDFSKISTKYTLTTQRCEERLREFSNRMKPTVLNIVYDISGNDILLCKTESIFHFKSAEIKQNHKKNYFLICYNNFINKNRSNLSKFLEILADIIKP